jgi:hypothetical protein
VAREKEQKSKKPESKATLAEKILVAWEDHVNATASGRVTANMDNSENDVSCVA